MEGAMLQVIELWQNKDDAQEDEFFVRAFYNQEEINLEGALPGKCQIGTSTISSKFCRLFIDHGVARLLPSRKLSVQGDL